MDRASFLLSQHATAKKFNSHGINNRRNFASHLTLAVVVETE
jgi:hypothetical protein